MAGPQGGCCPRRGWKPQEESHGTQRANVGALSIFFEVYLRYMMLRNLEPNYVIVEAPAVHVLLRARLGSSFGESSR